MLWNAYLDDYISAPSYKIFNERVLDTFLVSVLLRRALM